MLLSRVRRLVGAIKVEEKNGEIRISGLPADVIANDMTKVWGTSRVKTNLFSKIGGSYVTFPAFFALEFVFALETLQQETRTLTSRRSIKRILTLMREHTWLNWSDYESRLDRKHLRELVLTPLDHQEEFLSLYDINTGKMGINGYYLGAPPGSGKTFTGLALGKVLKKDAVVIFCPKTALREVWLKNIESYVKGKQKVWLSDTGQPVPDDADYYICHYEAMHLIAQASKMLGKRNLLIDIDESHNFNSSNTTRTDLLVQVCKETKATDILFASGTPFKAMATEMITYLRCCDPLFTREVEKRFLGIFGVSVARANDILSNRIGMVMYKVPKSVVMDDEPIVEDVQVKVPNSKRFTLKTIAKDMTAFLEGRVAYYKKHRSEYVKTYQDIADGYFASIQNDAGAVNEYTKEYLPQVKRIVTASDYRTVPEEIKWCNWYEKTRILPTLSNADKKRFAKAKGVYKYPELVMRGEALGGVLGRRRTECHLAMVKEVDFSIFIENSEKKTLIFTSYVEVLKEIAHSVEKSYKPKVVFADTNKDLQGIINAFDNDPKVNPLVATLKSLSTAVPVISANTVVFTDSPFRENEREQAIARVHRLGQDTQTYVFDLFLDTGDEPNVSTRSKDILEWSKAQVDQLLGRAENVALETITSEDYMAFEDSVQVIPKASSEELTTAATLSCAVQLGTNVLSHALGNEMAVPTVNADLKAVLASALAAKINAKLSKYKQ